MSESGLRVLVCGGRNYRGRSEVWGCLDRLRAERGVAVVIHGGASGADTLGAKWAITREVPQIAFRPNWAAFGPSAGPIRNRQMLDEGKPDVVIAFPGGRGTADMIRQATDAGVPVEQPCG